MEVIILPDPQQADWIAARISGGGPDHLHGHRLGPATAPQVPGSGYEAAAGELQGIEYSRWVFATEPEWAKFR